MKAREVETMHHPTISEKLNSFLALPNEVIEIDSKIARQQLNCQSTIIFYSSEKEPIISFHCPKLRENLVGLIDQFEALVLGIRRSCPSADSCQYSIENQARNCPKGKEIAFAVVMGSLDQTIYIPQGELSFCQSMETPKIDE